ncbi:MAG: hypothetical protein ACSW8H_07685, partial [bacterium]
MPSFTMKYGKKTLKEGTDYTFWTSNAKNVGTAVLSIKGQGQYKGTVRVPYNIVKRKAANVSARTRYQSYAYTGKERRPAVIVGFKVVERTIRLKKDQDYTLTYKNNIEPGKGKVIVKYQGNYTGKTILTFTIKPPAKKPYSVSKILALPAGTVLPEYAVDSLNLHPSFTIQGISAGDAIYSRMIGKSYRDNPHIPLSSLRYLKILHRNYSGNIQVGELVCNAAVADDLRSIFLELFAIGYQL